LAVVGWLLRYQDDEQDDEIDEWNGVLRKGILDYFIDEIRRESPILRFQRTGTARWKER